jgi:hypothetical protein
LTTTPPRARIRGKFKGESMPWPKGRRRIRKDASEVVRPTAISADIYRRVRDRAKIQGVSIRAVIEKKLLEYLEEEDA